MSLLATGTPGDYSTVFSSLDPTTVGAAGAVLLGAVLAVMIGLKWAKKIGNKAT